MGDGIIHQTIIKLFFNLSPKYMFYYVNKFPVKAKNVRTIVLNSLFCSLDAIFEFYKQELKFPSPYSNECEFNYSAFRDIMEELSWIPENVINICHESIPSINEEELGGVYLDVLNLIDAEREKFAESNDIFMDYWEEHPEKFQIMGEPTEWNRRQFFNVYFLHQDEQYVKKLLSDYSWDYRKCISFDESGTEQIDYKFRYTS